MTSFTSFNSASRPFIANDGLQVHSLDSIPQRSAYAALDQPSCYKIIWIKSGTGTMTSDIFKFPVSENSVYCFAPGPYRNLESPCTAEGYYISLSQTFLYQLESAVDFSFFFSADPPTVIHPDLEMEDLFVKMYDEYRGQHFLRSEILKGMLKVFMIYLSRQFEKNNQRKPDGWCQRDNEIVRKFFMLLKKHLTTKRLVAEYADELCITPNYLNAIVKKQTGIPASHHIQQGIILVAKRHAMYSSLSMKEVADKLGFEDYAHFSKFFKNYSGVNFSSFKKQMQIAP
jgi:AraC family transcriptional regulator, transcriptional activator of pobA